MNLEERKEIINDILKKLFKKQVSIYEKRLSKIIEENSFLYPNRRFSSYAFLYRYDLKVYTLIEYKEYIPKVFNYKTVPLLHESLHEKFEKLQKSQSIFLKHSRKLEMWLIKHSFKCECINQLYSLIPKEIYPNSEAEPLPYTAFLTKREREETKEMQELINYYLGLNFIL